MKYRKHLEHIILEEKVEREKDERKKKDEGKDRGRWKMRETEKEVRIMPRAKVLDD